MTLTILNILFSVILKSFYLFSSLPLSLTFTASNIRILIIVWFYFFLRFNLTSTHPNPPSSANHICFAISLLSLRCCHLTQRIIIFQHFISPLHISFLCLTAKESSSQQLPHIHISMIPSTDSLFSYQNLCIFSNLTGKLCLNGAWYSIIYCQ